MAERTWPFFLAATPTSGYRLVIAPDFMIGHKDVLGALRASPEHLAGTGSPVALREVDTAEGRFCIIYRVSTARMRDFGLGGDEPVTDQAGRHIDIFEGLVFQRSAEECAKLAVGTADLDRVRKLARDPYQRLWHQPGSFRLDGSKHFPLTGRGAGIQPALLAVPSAELPAAQEAESSEAADCPAGKERRKRSGSLRATAAGISALIACAAIGGIIWARSPAPPVLRPAALRIGWKGEGAIELDWAGPATGPLPTQYRVVLDQDGGWRQVFRVPGTRTSLWMTGLTPATTYSFRVAAIRDERVSPESGPLSASTVTPLPSQGLLRGSWPVRYQVTDASSHQNAFASGLISTASWDITPDCGSGACQEVTLTGMMAGRTHQGLRFSVPLHLSDGSYLGSRPGSIEVCPGQSVSPVYASETIDFDLRATRAGLDGGLWQVSAWIGNVTISVSRASYRSATTWRRTSCPGGTIQISVSTTMAHSST
jgi:Fibronectin type III domain